MSSSSGVEEKKHILLHASLVDKSSNIVIDLPGSDGRIFKKRMLSAATPTATTAAKPKSLVPAEARMVNAWFMIDFTDDSGLKLSEIFPDLPQEPPGSGLRDNVACLIDSSLYVYGGYGWPQNDRHIHQKLIRRLDIPNYHQGGGWSDCKPFDMDFAHKEAFVLGSKIYLFSSKSTCTTETGYVYDTAKQKGFFLHDNFYLFIDFFVPLEGHGMLLINLRQRLFSLLVVDDDDQSYEFRMCEDYQPFFDDDSKYKSVYDGFIHTVSNGIIYVLEISGFPELKMHAYDCWKGERLYTVYLRQVCRDIPERYYMLHYHSFQPEHLVAMSGSKFCLLWTFHRAIYCAVFSVSVSLNDDLRHSAEILEVRYFLLDDYNFVDLNNCLPVDAELGQMIKNPDKLLEETREEAKQQLEEEKLSTSKLTKKLVTRPYYLMHRRPLSKHLMFRKLPKKRKSMEEVKKVCLG